MLLSVQRASATAGRLRRSLSTLSFAAPMRHILRTAAQRTARVNGGRYLRDL